MRVGVVGKVLFKGMEEGVVEVRLPRSESAT